MNDSLIAPVQIVVDTDKLLDQLGWCDVEQDYDGEPVEVGGKYDLRSNLAGLVADRLADRLRDQMVDVVREILREKVTEHVGAIVEETIAAPIRKTNRYGEQSGESVTLREMVVDEAKAAMTRTYDRHGKPTGPYNRDGLTLVEQVANKAATEALRGELAEATTEAVAEVKAKVTGLVADELSARIARAVTR